MRHVIAYCALALVVLTSGCGTVCNLASEQPEVYGGLKRDLTVVAGVGNSSGHPVSLGSDPRVFLVLLALGGAEFGASFVGDTLSLPLILYLDKQEFGVGLLDEPLADPQFSSGATEHRRDDAWGTAMTPIRCYWSDTPWCTSPAPPSAPPTLVVGAFGNTADLAWMTSRPGTRDVTANTDAALWDDLETPLPVRRSVNVDGVLGCDRPHTEGTDWTGPLNPVCPPESRRPCAPRSLCPLGSWPY
jgi:hypothetical protein